jgi:hypothetical protein
MNSVLKKKTYPKEYTIMFNKYIKGAMMEAMSITTETTTQEQYKNLVMLILNIKMKGEM